MVTHIYNQKGDMTLRVYADDLTGLAGHNVSATETVQVTATASPPTSLTLASNKTSIFVSQSVTFTASAQDPAGDSLRFTINCGDGTYIVINTGSTPANQVVTVTATHTYWSAGTITARLYVTDGVSNSTALNPATITVTLNNPPAITPLTNKNGNAGASISFTASAFDPDGDTLRYTWDFGDGTALQAGVSTTHTYAKAGIYTFSVYVNDLTGLLGHNVSSSALARAAFNLPLAAGWNFVTVPVVGFGYKASNLTGLVLGDLVATWNSTLQAYDHTYIKGISPLSADFPIVPNAGYWVWVGAAKTLHLYGAIPTIVQSNIFLVPTMGWVAVGFSSLNATRHASDIPLMYSGSGAVTLIAFYNATTATYTTYISGLPTNNFLLKPGQGYWCWATASGVLAYVP
jgi:PKD repeat protein